MFFRFQRLRCESSQWTAAADLAFIDYEELPANVSAAYDDLLCSVMSTSQRFGDYQDDTVSQMSDAINREYTQKACRDSYALHDGSILRGIGKHS